MPLTLLTKRVQQTTFVAVFVDSSQGKVSVVVFSFELFTRPLLCYVYPGACGSTILSNQMRNSIFAQLNRAEIEMRI